MCVASAIPLSYPLGDFPNVHEYCKGDNSSMATLSIKTLNKPHIRYTLSYPLGDFPNVHEYCKGDNSSMATLSIKTLNKPHIRYNYDS